MKYTLTCEQDGFKTTTEFTEDYLPSVLENMQLFLRGCGFYFEGTLDIVDDEPPELDLYSEDYDVGTDWEFTGGPVDSGQVTMFDATDLQHSPNYYDTTRNKPVGA